MVRKKKLRVAKTLLYALLLMVFCGTAYGQLLFRRGMEEENYARTGYTQYERTVIARSNNPRYDYFGNYILDGVSAFYWNEEKINSRHEIASEKNSVIDKLNPINRSNYFSQYFGDFIVLNESNLAFSSRVIIANQMRVKFSPLTVDMAAFSGVRFDTNFAENNLTIIASRASVPLFFPEIYDIGAAQKQLAPVYLHGAHIERKMGLFNVSANYVNTYRSNSVLSRSQNSLTGTMLHPEALAANPTLQLAVKVEDGSRFDGGGPRVYDIYPLVNGEVRREYFMGVSRGNWSADFNIHKETNDPNQYIDQNLLFTDPMRVPDFYAFNYPTKASDFEQYDVLTRRFNHDPGTVLVDPENGVDFSAISPDGNSYLECNGEDYLIFWFDIPQDEDVNEVVIKALASNNYIFSIAEIYKDSNSAISSTSGLNRTKASSTFFEEVYFSKGDIKDESNLGWVSFEYGVPMANMLMSLRVDTEVKGFKFTSEYSRNLQFKQYKSLTNDSQKFRNDAEAYYINIMKEIGGFTLGTEYFKMDPDYSTTFYNTDPIYADEVGPTWSSYMYLDPAQTGNILNTGTVRSVINSTNPISTVDDNDDKDQFPDYSIFRTFRDINGVYPGLDKNGNNRPDTNENDNLRPDYDEPFFLYNSDPDEYDFGLDLNNNNTIDVRENDSRPDYPYDLDRKGYHVFGSFGEDLGWKYTFGYINMEKIAAGGQTDTKYGVAEYNTFIPFFADLRFSTIVKKTEDTIQDDVIKYARKLSTTLIDSTSYGYNSYDPSGTIIDERIGERYYDPLEYRNSYVSKSYFETNIFTIPNLTVGMKLKYDINHQNETSFQSENDIIDRTQVYRADYKYYFKNLLVQPQVKFMSRKYSNHDRYTRPIHEQYFYPIIKVEYPLTVSTTFMAGAQGIPGLNATVRNLVNDQLDYDSRDMIFMVSNRSFYSGYDFVLNLGYESRWQSFNGVARQAYNRTDRFYFVRLVVGVEPIS